MQILAKHKITSSCDRRPRRRDLYFVLHLVFSFLSRRISVVFLSDVLSDLKLLSSHSSLTFTQLLTAVTLLLLWQRGCVLMDAVLTSSSNIHSNVQPASSSVPDCVINKLRIIVSHLFIHNICDLLLNYYSYLHCADLQPAAHISYKGYRV